MATATTDGAGPTAGPADRGGSAPTPPALPSETTPKITTGLAPTERTGEGETHPRVVRLLAPDAAGSHTGRPTRKGQAAARSPPASPCTPDTRHGRPTIARSEETNHPPHPSDGSAARTPRGAGTPRPTAQAASRGRTPARARIASARERGRSAPVRVARPKFDEITDQIRPGDARGPGLGAQPGVQFHRDAIGPHDLDHLAGLQPRRNDGGWLDAAYRMSACHYPESRQGGRDPVSSSDLT